MTLYVWLRFLHVLGVVLLASGLLGGLVAQIRMRRSAALVPMIDALRYQETFGAFLVFPGALLIGASGLWMLLEAGFGFFDTPWLTAMWMLFAFEFIEGNTLTRSHGRHLRQSLEAMAPVASGRSDGVRGLLGSRLAALATGLDMGLGLLMIALGMLRPNGWGDIGIGLAVALVMAVALAALLLRVEPDESVERSVPARTPFAPVLPSPGGVGRSERG